MAGSTIIRFIRRALFGEEPTEFVFTPAQIARKVGTEARLQAQGVTINPGLPYTDDESEVKLRSATEVLDRILALSAVSWKALGGDELDLFVADFRVRERLSPREAAYFDDPSPGGLDTTQFSWRCEAAQELLWALGVETGRSEWPASLCDPSAVFTAAVDTAERGGPVLRPVSEILDALDLVYRCRWAVRNASLHGDTETADLEGGVCLERHWALNWLIRYQDEDWDDVHTDT
ncbi:DUF4272 domain-containing protein [Prosthecomicrobium hirschii]|uniref:DUF4272 domain-containing protein n=1 Tax=Prosthecodimorpha hirschii TaxID=665126 RepID=UPI00221FD7A7|nr:DUF4272 domain-containing protein [Prosthecomicrobium hirschii]MCW1841703.1 DUF4272 domain-containing protein [Prosthecomicrobium hirschii]